MTDETKLYTADAAATEETKASPEMKAITDEIAAIEERLKAQQATARKKIVALKRRQAEQAQSDLIANLRQEVASLRDEKAALEKRVAELESDNAELSAKAQKQSDYIKQHTSAGQQRAQQTGQQR